jgi:hypothetical protein
MSVCSNISLFGSIFNLQADWSITLQSKLDNWMYLALCFLDAELDLPGRRGGLDHEAEMGETVSEARLGEDTSVASSVRHVD